MQTPEFMPVQSVQVKGGSPGPSSSVLTCEDGTIRMIHDTPMFRGIVRDVTIWIPSTYNEVYLFLRAFSLSLYVVTFFKS